MALNDRKPIAHLLITLALTTGVMTYESWVPDAMIPIKGDVPTLGYGTTQYPNGEKVKLGDKTTRVESATYLQHDLDKYRQGMLKCVKAPLYQHEFNSYLSLTYNIGVAGFCNSSIPVKLNAGNYTAACETILQFNKASDPTKPKIRDPRTGAMKYQLKVVKGLDNRRKSEYKTCKGGPE